MANSDRIAAVGVAVALVVAACSSGGAHKGVGSTTGSPTSRAPASTTAAAAAPATLLLVAADLAGYSSTPTPTPAPIPCGSRFGDQAGSMASASAAFVTPGNQQLVDETVVAFGAARAAEVASAFRSQAAGCSQFDDLNGPTVTYQVRALSAPAVTADDVVAVSLASPAHFYELVLLRSGADVAWLALGQLGNPVDPATLATVTAAAARRLHGG